MTDRVTPPQPPSDSPGGYAVKPTRGAARRIARPTSFVPASPAATAVTAAEAARDFSNLVSRVSHQRETFVIESGGRALCQLRPVNAGTCTGADLLALLAHLPRPDDSFIEAVERIGRAQPPVAESPWLNESTPASSLPRSAGPR